jgi:FkbM family methyltransferase
MEVLKQIIRKTPIFKILKNIQLRRIANRFSQHDLSMLNFYSSFLSSGDLCFDVGANTGNRTKIFLKLGARVVAIEPQKECADHISMLYGHKKQMTLVRKALGAKEGEAEMQISSVNVISSISQEWIDSVKKSGRFAKYKWDKSQTIQLTTLDSLISSFGIPAFIKIDVEGYEYEVLKGLSKPLKFVSFEFTPEFMESTFFCIDHLERLGKIRLNYSLGESMKFANETWKSSNEMKAILDDLKNDHTVFGDVYVKFV